MVVLKTILLVLLIIIAVLLAIIILILLIPFKYNLNCIYKNEDRLELDLKFIFFRITGYLVYTPELDFELKLWNKVILKKKSDDEEDEDEEEDNSIADTDFIENKDLEDDVKESKSAIRDLFASAKKMKAKKEEEYELELDEEDDEDIDEGDDEIDDIKKEKEEKEKKAFNLIDKFKNLLDNDIIYVIKRVTSEGINVLNVIKPSKYKVTIKKGTKDPYVMGMTLAIAAPLYAFMGDDLKVVKNSESAFTWSCVYMTGTPQLYKLIPPIFRLLKDKRFRGIVFKKK